MQMHYERTGQGKPLLLIHGIGGNCKSWDPIISQLALQREVIALSVGVPSKRNDCISEIQEFNPTNFLNGWSTCPYHSGRPGHNIFIKVKVLKLTVYQQRQETKYRIYINKKISKIKEESYDWNNNYSILPYNFQLISTHQTNHIFIALEHGFRGKFCIQGFKHGFFLNEAAILHCKLNLDSQL